MPHFIIYLLGYALSLLVLRFYRARSLRWYEYSAMLLWPILVVFAVIFLLLATLAKTIIDDKNNEIDIQGIFRAIIGTNNRRET